MSNTLKDVEYGWPVTIEPNHYRTHAGQAFVSGNFWSETAGNRLADNGYGVILIKPKTEMHLRIGADSGGDAEVRFFKGVSTTTSTLATAAIILNKSGGSTKTSSATITWGSSVLVSTYGTGYPGRFLAGGIGGNAAGGSIGDLHGELNLSTSAGTYAVRVINRGGVVQPASIVLDWYEPHTDP